jgi:exodeoxyribonuclease III
MRIISWNVNGIRAILKKDFKKTISELNPDILCLQEVKATEKQVDEEEIQIDGYRYVWNAAERLGYSGTATYIKNELEVMDFQKGFGVPEFDIEGRSICTSFAVFDLYNIYFPNGQRGMDRVEYKIRFYEKLLDICTSKHSNGKGIIITGDFNTAHEPIDLANPKENEKYSGFLPIEREWVTKFLDNGFNDVFRTINPDKAQYTWWTYRFAARARGIGWRIDYFLVSNHLFQKVKKVEILDSVLGSDHCPIVLEV